MRDIKEGDVVTIIQDATHQVSNTYVVVKSFDELVLLRHPLAPDCLITKPVGEINIDMAVLKAPVEKCLDFAKSRQKDLGYTSLADLDALCYYYVVRKTITPKQRHELSLICGKLAAIELGHNLSLAADLVKRNMALLDEYMLMVYKHSKEVIDSPSKVKSKTERFTIFNLAGFILANSK